MDVALNVEQYMNTSMFLVIKHNPRVLAEDVVIARKVGLEITDFLVTDKEKQRRTIEKLIQFMELK